VREALDDGTVTTPEERGVESDRLRVVQPLADSSSVPESVRIAGFADGVQSVLAIPLVYGSNVHGVVGIYAGGTEAFSEREHTSFETLRDVAGFAVTAARNRNLLLSDSVAEITLDVGDDSVLTTLSRSLDSTLTLDGIIPQGDDTLLCFVSVRGDAVDTIDEITSDIDGIDDVSDNTFESIEYLRIHEPVREEIEEAEVSGELAAEFGYHAPCHARNQGLERQAVELFGNLEGAEMEDVGKSCSGISGTYGWKSEKYEKSMKIGDEMFEHMEEGTDSELGMTECPTCAMQMEHGTGYEIRHPIELLEAALVEEN